jgi:chorismate mutase
MWSETEMSSLKEKAFKICVKWDSIGKTCLEERYAVWLEDAQKEIDSLEKQIEKEIMIRCEYSEQIVELKQKLQQLLNDFPESEFVTMGNLKAISSTFKGEEVQNWKKKFEELLKEAKMNET